MKIGLYAKVCMILIVSFQSEVFGIKEFLFWVYPKYQEHLEDWRYLRP